MSLMQTIAGQGYPAQGRKLPRGCIVGAAKELGVTREHLSRVVNGQRDSRSLLRRFAQHQAKATAQR